MNKKVNLIVFAWLCTAIGVVGVSSMAGYHMGELQGRIASQRAAIEAGAGIMAVDDKTGAANFIFLKPETAEVHQKRAIDANVAHFVADPKTGRVEFQFLKPDRPEEHQQKAIAANVASWSINPQTGVKSFNFISPKVEPSLPMPQKEKDNSGLSIRVPLPKNEKE